jgi:hypothetical protein
MGAFILWLFGMALSIPLTIFRGYVIVNMWNWFVVTQFSSAPHISITGAIGLSLLASLFQHLPSEKEDKHDAEDAMALMIVSLIKGGILTLILWGMAAIVHCYM